MTKARTHRPKALFQMSNVLWHLDVFRRSFRDLTGHACLAESCLFCALKELFSELQHSPAKALPPDSLRKALADSFLDQQKFQIGFMDDAAECFENMLLRIHDHIAHKEPEDACSAPHCVSHQKFAMTLVEQSICDNCGATTEPMSFTQMVQYVSTSTLVHQLRVSVGQTGRPETFGRLLQKAANMGENRPCPASCGSVTHMCRALMNHPEIVSIGLVWNTEKPTAEHIMEVFSCIDTTLRLNHVFNNVTDQRWAEQTTHNLVGVVTYYGKHYSTFFFHTKLMEWIFLDDATVRDVGPRWEQVVEKCRKGKFQPLLLLYASPNGTPVNLEYAPKLNTPFYTDKARQPAFGNQQILRRSVTPSPEKPIISSTRRAITPNPENSPLNQKPPKPFNEYQNLSVIQNNISMTRDENVDQLDGCINQKPPLARKALDMSRPQVNIHRTLSNGSSSGVESGVCIPDHLNIPRRRDSGNWSGDRNSASSASSTTMENPYLYLVGKVPPGSPTRTKLDGNGAFDAGYDSYSLSSNDSTNMTTLQHMMKTGHLAQIPEDYSNVMSNQNSLSCDVLCDEADELLVKSRQLEDAHDLVLALALCNAAATKARAAMNAPYNNPQTLTLARMKHNTCIMRARSLHRRMTQTQAMNKGNSPDIRHTREGSSGSGRHTRQNSRDKGRHSRQNSRELLVQQEKEKAKTTKSIEIYATLPKKKDALRAKLNIFDFDDGEYAQYSKSPERESRSIFSRSKNKDQKTKEKRSRSEDRNKISTGDFSLAPEIITGKDTLKKAKENKEKEEKKDKDGKNKKQHKIRRKLLMGGLIRRKNRSMPDLTDANGEENRQVPQTIADDSKVGLRANGDATKQGISGYLSEGHLEFTGDTANPNLERSKLMRKSFHSSAGKILTAAKVPPPPPLRTTSQLSRSKLSVAEVSDKTNQLNMYEDSNIYHNLSAFNQSQESEQSSMSLPYYGNSNSSFDDDSFPSSRTVVTQAVVHYEQSPISPNGNHDSGLDEVDCFPTHRAVPLLELPPYPSPGGSAVHSRQASEDFPPPPPPLDLSALDEHLPQPPNAPESSSLLAQLQSKRQEILTPESSPMKQHVTQSSVRSSGDTWLKELQAKQAALRMKKSEEITECGTDEVNTQRYISGEVNIRSVRDIASKFENPEIPKAACSSIGPEQIAEEIREVEMLTSAVNKVLSANNQDKQDDSQKNRPQKKKSVSFCDQVILVATAEEQEEETYIPNPILERVLRSAANNPETNAVRNELNTLREQQNIQNSAVYMEHSQQKPPAVVHAQHPENPLYVRGNSMENLLNQESNVANGNAYLTGTSYGPSSHQQQQNYTPTPHVPAAQQPLSYSPLTNGLSPQQQNFNSSSQQQQYQYGYHQQNNHDSFYHHNGQEPRVLNNHQGAVHNVNELQNPHQPLYNGYYNRGLPDQHLRPINVDQHSKQPLYGDNQYKAYQSPPHPPLSQPTHIPYTQPLPNYQAPEMRQSPYQPIPANSQMHPCCNGNARPPSRAGLPVNSYNYSSSPRSMYHPQTIRQTTPSPSSYLNTQHSPSPVPSVSSSTQNYLPVIYRASPTTSMASSVYQRVPPPNGEYPQNYPADPQQYQRQNVAPHQDVYQRVPPPHGEETVYPHVNKYPPYQQIPQSKFNLKKTVSFEPGTKGCESPIPKATMTPIVVNNSHTSIPTDKTKCSLCRKKNVVALNLYCKDCEFYMSRFKPKT